MRHLLILVPLSEEQSVASAQYELFRNLVGETGPRSEIIVIALYDRGAETIPARKRKCPILDVKEAAEISSVYTLGEEFISGPG